MVGLVVTAACSSYFSMTSYRGDSYKTIEFVNGELKEGKVTKLKNPKHGLCVKFIPSSKLENGIKYAITSGESPLINKVELLLKDRICNTYKDLL